MHLFGAFWCYKLLLDEEWHRNAPLEYFPLATSDYTMCVLFSFFVLYYIYYIQSAVVSVAILPVREMMDSPGPELTHT